MPVDDGAGLDDYIAEGGVVAVPYDAYLYSGHRLEARGLLPCRVFHRTHYGAEGI